MTYLKALLVGLLTAVVAEVLWVLVAVVLPFGALMGLASVSSSGSGGLGAVSVAVPGPAALVGFLLGFGISLRRSLRRRRPRD